MNGSEGGEAGPDEPSPIEAQLAAPPPPTAGDDPIAGRGATSPAGSLLQSKAAVLAILFLATGFLGLPLLWINRRFSTLERIVWSVLVTIYTIALIALAAVILVWSYRRIVG